MTFEPNGLRARAVVARAAPTAVTSHGVPTTAPQNANRPLEADALLGDFNCTRGGFGQTRTSHTTAYAAARAPAEKFDCIWANVSVA